jgi:hypothetical protein
MKDQAPACRPVFLHQGEGILVDRKEVQ